LEAEGGVDMRTIAIINQKGGCGKTTVAINTAAAFSREGKRVILIDLDPQAHSSMGLNVYAEDTHYNTYDILMNPRVLLQNAVTQVNDNLYLVPSSSILSAFEQEMAGKDGRERRLVSKINRASDYYHYIIIDSPPNVGLLTFNALVAAGEVIIPVDPSYFSIQGLTKLIEMVELLESETKHKIKLHVLANNIEKRNNFSRDIIMELDNRFGSVMLDTIITHSVRYKEASLRGVPIFDLGNAKHLQKQYISLSHELEEKVSKVEVRELHDWMARLHGPKRVEEGVLFTLDAPGAESVELTGEFNNWSREGLKMEKDEEDGLWKLTLDLEPGEYEYRYIVDSVWIKDPANTDSVLNEFGQENSLLIV
jgi:chromosome partitioning protein